MKFFCLSNDIICTRTLTKNVEVLHAHAYPLWILRRDPPGPGSRSVEVHIFGVLDLARPSFFQRSINGVSDL